MKIGLLGGTFNPVHIGHLILAQECWYVLELDKVIFIPAYIPPHKKVEGEVSPADRLNMVRLALEGDARFGISTYEIDKQGISYSIDTIRYMRELYGPETELFFLTGADSLEGISEWKDVENVLSESVFVVAKRPGRGGPVQYGDKVKSIEMPQIDISSTGIRERIRAQMPIDHMVPASVSEFIRNKGLYRS